LSREKGLKGGEHPSAGRVSVVSPIALKSPVAGKISAMAIFQQLAQQCRHKETAMSSSKETPIAAPPVSA